ncbi:MAG: N-acetylmuramoyl-L-alanine amidase family protein [Proteocatella sp.]
MRVFIGVGHGGSDCGAEFAGLREKDINLDIALAMKVELEKYGVEVILSRSVDTEVSPMLRIKKANSCFPDLAVDIHVNAGGGTGFEAYVQTGKFKAESNTLAKFIEFEIKQLGKHSRGIKAKLDSKGKDYFGFLRDIRFPAVILEAAFIDSNDANNIKTKDKRKAYAVAYARGIIRYLGTRELSCEKVAS